MEAVRWFRGLAPLAALPLLAGMGIGIPHALSAADPPWQPPPCRGTDGRVGPGPAAITWYRMDAVLDATGTLAGQRLTLGVLGGRSRHLDLPPESFASGPVQGQLLVGDDNGSSSRLRILDVDRGCATPVTSEADVIRSAILAPDGGAIWEHRVDRAMRADLGIWRRGPDPDTTTRVLTGVTADERYGPTFATELRWTGDGRLAVSSCGELACRSRVLDPATGHVASVEGTGPMVGVDGDSVIAHDVCHGFPCPIVGVDAVTGRRTTLVEEAGPASMGGVDGHTLVFEGRDGFLETFDLRSGTRRRVTDGGGLMPVRDGSMATSFMAVPAGAVLVAPDGRVTDPSAARAIDSLGPAVEDIEEAVR